MRYFKVLDINNCSCYGGNKNIVWSLPVKNADGSWTPGKWMSEVQGDYHLTDAEHLLDCLNAVIYEAEPSDERVEGDDEIVCRSVRLLKKMCWDDRIMRLFACDCAEHILRTNKRILPDNKDARHAIDVARQYANGKVSDSELAGAEAAAWSTVHSIAQDAAWYAVRATVRLAALDSAREAAWDATCAVAWNEGEVAWGPEHKWQVERLMRYLEGN